MFGDIPDDTQKKKEEYWLKNKLLIAGLLSIWAIFSFVICIFLAEPLSEIYFFELPLSFWIAQQGTMVLFVFLIFFYAWKMDHLDEQYDVSEVIVGEVQEEKIKQAKEETGDTFDRSSGAEDDPDERSSNTEGAK